MWIQKYTIGPITQIQGTRATSIIFLVKLSIPGTRQVSTAYKSMQTIAETLGWQTNTLQTSCHFAEGKGTKKKGSENSSRGGGRISAFRTISHNFAWHLPHVARLGSPWSPWSPCTLKISQNQQVLSLQSLHETDGISAWLSCVAWAPLVKSYN